MVKTLDSLILKIKNGEIPSWNNVKDFIDIDNLSDSEWGDFFNRISELLWKNKNKNITTYIPGKNFPSISVTGEKCELNCKHCNKKYLHNMLQGDTEEKLKEILERCIERECKGVLLSGGSTSEGKVPLLKFSKTIKEFKEHHPNFQLNSHVGLVNFEEALQLKHIGIDVVSYDLVLDDEVITEVFQLEKNKEDYKQSYENLQKAGLFVAPHILVGGNYGVLVNEWKNIKYLHDYFNEKVKEKEQSGRRKFTVVIIAMIPPKFDGVVSSEFREPTPVDVAKTVFLTKIMLKNQNVEVSLGCMHPRGENRFLMEKFSILAGSTHIAMPSQKTLRWLKDNNYEVTPLKTCCSIPYNK